MVEQGGGRISRENKNKFISGSKKTAKKVKLLSSNKEKCGRSGEDPGEQKGGGSGGGRGNEGKREFKEGGKREKNDPHLASSEISEPTIKQSPPFRLKQSYFQGNFRPFHRGYVLQ